MTPTITLTAEHAPIVSVALAAGEPRVVLVVEGDLDLRCDNCGASASLPLGMTCSNHLAKPTAPTRFAAHDKACERCIHLVKVGNEVIDIEGGRWAGGRWVPRYAPFTCPDCHGTGREVVQLVVLHPCHACAMAQPEDCDGHPHTVPLAPATIEVVPVVAGADPCATTHIHVPTPPIAVLFAGEPGRWSTTDLTNTLPFTPEPGRHFGIVVTFVGVTP